MSGNALDTLPAWRLPALIELRALDLDLYKLPDLELPSLRELHLRRNKFEGVPKVLRSLRELRVLDMRSNWLTSVPDWIVELPRLEKLDLRWNEVYSPPQELIERGCVVLTE